jgi:hypothetical protein
VAGSSVDKLPENSPVRFLAEIALHGFGDPKGKMSADELAVQTRLITGGVRTEIFNANLLPFRKA